MKYYSVFFFLLFLSCSQKKEHDVITILKSNAECPIAFLYCVKFNDGYVMTTENNEVFFLNQNLEIDQLQTQKIQPKISSQGFNQYLGHLIMYQDQSGVKNPYVLNEKKEWILGTDTYFSDVVYEDETYVISATCYGEFGGTVFFKHKETTTVYSCTATCLTGINKLNDIYYITSSLDFANHSEILVIEDPTALVKMKKGIPLLNNWWMNEGYMPQDLLKGTEKIIDTFGILIHDSFKVHDRLYFLNEKELSAVANKISRGNIILSTLEDQKLVTIDTLHIGESGLGTLQKTNSYSFYLFNYQNEKVFITRRKDTIEVLTLQH